MCSTINVKGSLAASRKITPDGNSDLHKGQRMPCSMYSKKKVNISVNKKIFLKIITHFKQRQQQCIVGLTCRREMYRKLDSCKVIIIYEVVQY